MKIKGVLGIIIITVGVSGLGFFQSFQAHSMKDSYEVKPNQTDQVKILNATLQIEISISIDAKGSGTVKGKGLASLVWDGERTLLVTHNHWGEILQERADVKFYDARGQLVKTMSGSEFISLMCYLDGGTLILSSPAEWIGEAQPVVENDPLQVKAGDFVMVAQHDGSKQMEVTLVKAQVEAVTTYRGVPVYKLKDLEGKPAQKGDSGGGIWYKGKFVGNLWYRMKVEPTLLSLFSSDRPDQARLETGIESYAAGYPSNQLKAFLEQLGNVERGEIHALP
jgi:hypothetical protein